MASQPSVPIVSGFDLTDEFQDIFLVPTDVSRISIDAAVFNNYTSSNVKITVRIAQTTTSDIFDEIITLREIRALENFLSPALVGQAIFSGGVIQAKADTNSAVNCNITATKITT